LQDESNAKDVMIPDRLDDQDERDLSRAELAYKRLRQGIRVGEFRPGQRLREAELATLLNVSRTPIREAIRRLASDGLIEFAPSRGVMIINLDKQQVRELYALRETLEGAAARLAAQHASPAEIAAMRELLEAGKLAQEPGQLARLNRLFHQAIHDAAHNRYLAQALVQLSDSLALLPGTTFEVPGRSEAAYEEQLAIVDAIESRELKKAEELARHHIAMAGQTRIRMMFGAA
jgi:DNA-binding GntR family transcriptional regulator